LIQQIYFLEDYKIIQKASAGIEKKDEHTYYTGSLIKSYIQSHLTPRWNPLINRNQIQDLVILEPFKNKAYTMLKNSISTTRTLKETLSRRVYTTTFTQERIRREST